MNEWWRWHRLHTLARFGRNFVCHVTYLPISPQERPRFELSNCGYLQQPVEFKIVRTKKIITYQTPQSNLPFMLLFTRHNEPIKDDIDTSALSLTRSIYVLLMTSQSIADVVTSTLPEATALEKRYLTQLILLLFTTMLTTGRAKTPFRLEWHKR